MTDLLDEIEATPATYPASPIGMSDPASWIDAAIIWERIEAYTRTRYTPREVVWKIQGQAGSEWKPPLSPLVSRDAHFWGDQWEGLALLDGPVGICFPFDGVYRITAQVGYGTPPKAVTEAFRRLAEYMADDTDRAGVSSYSVNMGGAIQESYQRNAAHAARALQNSGAADMLRPYRRQK
ncbi:hypothetical protein OS189_03810 [Sulfitobacter sp. F26169L]|uniref:hypothetical protein n=1 Tax=Sulfitobacter sp. F26169L TaxID=2996015 RepID=UPI002260DDCE|nr:hypothetical protein [Sulfitobacter sp. F26169L]MCX7565470.1 hypothetical protein [Sulfitobacter sp. F26169L]